VDSVLELISGQAVKNRPASFYCPVPVSATVCGLLAALSRIVRVAERATLRVGWNVTLIVHWPPPASPAPPIGQLLV
jgi:hypothetical protein